MSQHNEGTIEAGGNYTIPDPGTGGTISTRKSGICLLTSAAAGETRALPRPYNPGQEIYLFHKALSGGGTVIVTPAGTAVSTTLSTINTLTTDTVNELARFIAMKRADGLLYWHMTFNIGWTFA